MGHIFTFMTYDLLQRRLEDLGYEVRLVRNVTDVDEPMYAKAAQLGVDYRQLAAAETERLQTVLRRLHFRPAYAEPRASEYIEAMSAAVLRLLEQDYAYRLENDIYFDVSKVQGYGWQNLLPERLLEPLLADRGGDPGRPGKRQPLDFLLWRGVTDPADVAAWDTGLGRGRPGWHIECTVMSGELLGAHFDIHGGGMDLIFPHHASEIAQAKALAGAEPACHWLHVAPLLLYGEKMSKSLGNLVFAHVLLEAWSPAAIRLALMRYHYRTGGEWHDGILPDAQALADRLQAMMTTGQLPDMAYYLKRVRQALDDDLDTPRIVSILEELAASTHTSGKDLTGKRADLRILFSLLGLADDTPGLTAPVVFDNADDAGDTVPLFVAGDDVA